jgi:hypothetical protein
MDNDSDTITYFSKSQIFTKVYRSKYSVVDQQRLGCRSGSGSDFSSWMPIQIRMRILPKSTIFYRSQQRHRSHIFQYYGQYSKIFWKNYSHICLKQTPTDPYTGCGFESGKMMLIRPPGSRTLLKYNT